MPVFDFEGFTNGTLLDAAYPSLVKQAVGNTSTLSINNGNLDYNWLSGGNAQIAYAYNTGSANHYVQGTYANIRKGDYYPGVLRCSDSRNYIGWRITTANNLEVNTFINGAGAILISAAVTLAIGSTVRIECEGNTIRAYFDGVLKGTATSTFNNTVVHAGFAARVAAALQVLSTATVDSLVPNLVIDDVNGDEVVAGGSTGNTATLTGSIQNITSGNIDGLALTNFVNGTGVVDFDVPDPVHGAVYPEVSYYNENTSLIVPVTQVLTLAGSTQSDTINITFDPLAEYSVVRCRNVELIDDTFIAPHLEDVPVDDSDAFWYLPADCDLTGRGGVTTDEPKTTTIAHWISSSGVMKIYALTINSGGVVSGGGLTTRGLTVSGMTARGLTVTGL